jgi:hypothetical protein
MRAPLLIILIFITPGILAESIPNSIREYVTSQMESHTFFSGKLSDWAEGTRQFYVERASSENKYANFISAKPWHVNIDFNVDGRMDWVGFLVKPSDPGYMLDNWVDLYCICSKNDNYENILLHRNASPVRDENAIDVGVHISSPGFYPRQVDGGEDANIEFPGVILMHYEKYSGIYYWDNGEIKWYTMSD